MEMIGRAAQPMSSVLNQIELFMTQKNDTKREIDRLYKELAENEELLLNISEEMPILLSRTRIAKGQIEQQASIDETFNQQLLNDLEVKAQKYFQGNETDIS